MSFTDSGRMRVSSSSSVVGALFFFLLSLRMTSERDLVAEFDKIDISSEHTSGDIVLTKVFTIRLRQNKEKYQDLLQCLDRTKVYVSRQDHSAICDALLFCQYVFKKVLRELITTLTGSTKLSLNKDFRIKVKNVLTFFMDNTCVVQSSTV